MAESIGEILNDHMQALMLSQDFSGLEMHIVEFMQSFTKPEGISQLVLWLGKVEINTRFDLMNQIMHSRIPEGFPTENTKLWHALTTMIHSVLAVTTKDAVTDERMTAAMKDYSEGKNPYLMEAN